MSEHDLSRAVAERVLGWKIKTIHGTAGLRPVSVDYWDDGNGKLVHTVLGWSAESAEGMLAIIEAMRRNFTMRVVWIGDAGHVDFTPHDAGSVTSIRIGSACHESIPRAVALAALAAIGGGE